MSQEYIINLETAIVKAVENQVDDNVTAVYKTAKTNVTEREDARKLCKEMKAVDSTNIRFVAYDENAKRLTVVFTNGGFFQYKEVPPDIYSHMMVSESKGSYFSKNVRNIYQCINLGKYNE